MFFMEVSDATTLERNLANSSSVHARSQVGDMKAALDKMKFQLKSKEELGFDGEELDNCCHILSVMPRSQWITYQREYGMKIPMNPTSRKTLNGFWVKGELLGYVNIQIPFPNLGLIIDVEFSGVKKEVQTLLSNCNIIKNGLNMRLQDRYPYIVPLRQQLN